MSQPSRVSMGEIAKHVGKKVKVCGFVQSLRDQKRRQFLVLRDHTGKVQTIHEKSEIGYNLSKIISSLTPESAVAVSGLVVENSDVKLGGVEIVVEEVEIGSLAATPLPIAPQSSPEKQLDWRFLSLRQPANHLIFRVQTAMEQVMRLFWEVNGFIEIHSPKLMGVASESGAELFELQYFKQKAYLAQSPQFYKQMAIVAGFDRVFEIGPVFRANPSFTPRHDAEFTSLDVEVAWIRTHEDIMAFEEEWLRFVLSCIALKHGPEIEDVFGIKLEIPLLPFPRMTLNEAMNVLDSLGHTIGHREDLDPQGERILSEYIRRKFSHEFVFVTDYPVQTRPFYHMRHPENPGLTRSFDLLWKGLEVTTGAQREHRVDILERQAIEKGLSLEPLKHYLDFFRYGCPPHGGYGAGLTRLLMVLLERPNVREVTFLYRGPNRLTP